MQGTSAARAPRAVDGRVRGLHADARVDRARELGRVRDRPRSGTRAHLGGRRPRALRRAQQRDLRADRRRGAALFLCAGTMACTHPCGRTRALRGAAGAHTAAFPVQQHERDREPDPRAAGAGRGCGRGSVRPVSRRRSVARTRVARLAKNSISRAAICASKSCGLASGSPSSGTSTHCRATSNYRRCCCSRSSRTRSITGYSRCRSAVRSRSSVKWMPRTRTSASAIRVRRLRRAAARQRHGTREHPRPTRAALWRSAPRWPSTTTASRTCAACAFPLTR